jgi:hypothetical protein
MKYFICFSNSSSPYVFSMSGVHLQGDLPDDGGSKHLWNVGKLLADYMA